MGLVRTTDAATEPVTLVEAKKQVEVATSSTAHDDHLNRLIESERKFVEQYTRRALISQTWRLNLTHFTDRVIALPRPPLTSVTSVKYYDPNGTQQTLVEGTDYRVNTTSNPGAIYFINGGWPPVDIDRLDAVEVIYVAGYASADDVPDTFKEVILNLVAHKFSNRGDSNTHQTFVIPAHIRGMLKSLKLGTWGGFYGVTE